MSNSVKRVFGTIEDDGDDSGPEKRPEKKVAREKSAAATTVPGNSGTGSSVAVAADSKTSIANDEKWLFALSRLVTDDDLKDVCDDIKDSKREVRGACRQGILHFLELLLGTDVATLILGYAPERNEIHAYFGGPLIGRILQIRLQVENVKDAKSITNEAEYTAVVGDKNTMWLSAVSLDDQDDSWGELDMHALRDAIDTVVAGHLNNESEDKTGELQKLIDAGNASGVRFVNMHRAMATFKKVDQTYDGPKTTSLHEHILLSEITEKDENVFHHNGRPFVTLDPAHLYINPKRLEADSHRVWGPEDVYSPEGLTKLPIFKRGSLADVIQEIRSKVPRGSLWHKLMVLADSSTRIQLNYMSPKKQ